MAPRAGFAPATNVASKATALSELSYRGEMVRPEGFAPPASAFGGRHSIGTELRTRLAPSDGVAPSISGFADRRLLCSTTRGVVRPEGFAPSASAFAGRRSVGAELRAFGRGWGIHSLKARPGSRSLFGTSGQDSNLRRPIDAVASTTHPFSCNLGIGRTWTPGALPD